MSGEFWWSDWAYRDGVVSVKSTGHRLPLRLQLIATCLNWLLFYSCIQVWRLAALHKRGPRIAFLPEEPRPWYFIWACMHVIGGRIVSDPAKADVAVYFEDRTFGAPPSLPVGSRSMNFACQDISKSHVGRTFEKVFGYSIAIDPSTHAGPMVEKSECNGAHDGQVINGPAHPRPNRVYQKLIDNRLGDRSVLDYRCVVVGRQMPLVFTKTRHIGQRFTNTNAKVERMRPENAFSKDESEKLIEFAEAIGLEWGALDVLRDRINGRIYVVDVNKTNIDPPVAMPLVDKLKATSDVASSLNNLIPTRYQG